MWVCHGGVCGMPHCETFFVLQAGAAFPDMGKAKGAVGRVFPLLDRVPAIDPEAPAKQDPPSEGIQGEVAYNKVKFL